MTRTFTRSLSATAAIAAVLALGSTPALAQDAAPTIQLDAPTVTTSAAPVAAAPVVTPPAAALEIAAPQTAAPVASEPVRAEPRAAPARSTHTAATRAPAPRSAAPESAEPKAAAAPAKPAVPARASSANILNANPTRPIGTVARAPAPAAAPATPADNGIPGEAVAGLLAALGLGAVGYAVMRSRRRRAESEEVFTAEAPLELTPALAPAAFGMPQDMAANTEVRYGFTPARGDAGDAQVIEREPMVVAPPVAPLAARAPQDSTAPASAEDRSAQLDRMVEAAPDEANPFTSAKARRKRARLLLQQQGDTPASTPAFDWRTYQSARRMPEGESPERQSQRAEQDLVTV